MLRSTLLAALVLAASCASGPSFRERAEEACRGQGYSPGPGMDECVLMTEEALRRARERQPPPTPRPPG